MAAGTGDVKAGRDRSLEGRGKRRAAALQDGNLNISRCPGCKRQTQRRH
jgi:hypothetical protein